MKVSFIADIDYANVLTEYSHCFNKHSDIESKSICLKSHPFNYKIQHDYDLESATLEQRKEALQFITESDCIVFAEENSNLTSTYWMLDHIKDILGVDILELNSKVCIWHAGSTYRNNATYYNLHPLKHKLHKSLYGIDLYRLSPKSEKDVPIHVYQYFDFDYDQFIADFKLKVSKKPWTVLHIPSNTNTKGTYEINETISQLDLDPNVFEYKNITGIPHPQVIEEKQNSIFYIDQFNPNIGGYGISTLESIINANFTFSTVNNISDSIHYLTGEYEVPLVSLGSSETDLYLTLEEYIKNIDESTLIEYMMGIGQWIETHYSHKVIIQNFKDLL